MQTRKTILVVDDTSNNLRLARNALVDIYDVITMPSAEKMYDFLAMHERPPDLILLDVLMPGMDGYQAIRLLKGDERYKEIPVLFLTSSDDKENEYNGLTLGALDYIRKPFVPELLRKRIEMCLLIHSQKEELRYMNKHLYEIMRKKTQEVQDLRETILSTISELIESRDDETGGHIARTAHTLDVLIKGLIKMDIYAEEFDLIDIDLLIESSQLHDVGKISIHDKILLKPDKLTEEEFEIMKRHVEYGVKIIDRIQKKAVENEFLSYARVMVETHHEKWDGTGYPNGLLGEDIPLYGRLMAIVDVYDALVSDRPYKKALSSEEAMKIISDSKTTHFDPTIAEVFPQIIQENMAS